MARRSRTMGGVVLLTAVLLGGSAAPIAGIAGGPANVRVNKPVDSGAGDGTNITQNVPVTLIVNANFGVTLFGDTAGYAQGSGIGYATSKNAGKSWTDRGQITVEGRKVSGLPNVAWDAAGNRVLTVVNACDEATKDCDLYGFEIIPPGTAFNQAFVYNFDSVNGITAHDVDIEADDHGYYYLAWTQLQTNTPPAVFLATSTNGGTTFNDPVRVSDPTDTFAAAPSIAVDPEKQKVFVAYGHVARTTATAGTPGVYTMKPNVASSDDEGVTWTRYSAFTGYTAAGELYNCGTPEAPVPTHLLPGNFDALDYPDIATNPINNEVYITFTANPPGDDKAGVYFSRSINNGESFSTPVEIAKNPQDQFFPDIAVDANGIIGIGAYDRRNDPTKNKLIDVYFYVSVDLGSHWLTPWRVTTVNSGTIKAYPSFDSINRNCYWGGKVSLLANGSFYAAWVDNRDKGPAANNGRDPNIYFNQLFIPTTLTAAVAKTSTKLNVTGKLTPTTLVGATVNVTLARRNSAGAYATVRTLNVRSGTGGAYTASFTRPAAGSCRVTAKFAGNEDYAAVTKVITVTC